MAGTEKLSAKLTLPGGKEATLPVIVGTEDEHAVDIRSLRQESGYITLDSGFMNTGSTTSAITYLDGEKGVLRYRGYSIEDLAEKSDFVETSYLLINGELPTKQQREVFSQNLTRHSLIHEAMHHFFAGYPVEPIDIHASIRHLEALRDMSILTDKPFHAYSLGKERICDSISELSNSFRVSTNFSNHCD